MAITASWQLRPGKGDTNMSRNTEFATAPYNFVSTAKAVLPSPLDQGLRWDELSDSEIKKHFAAYIQEESTYSGTIELQLEALTPLFIGTEIEEDTKESQFFVPNRRPVIPGSSLRGMFRNLFKIVTAGAMRADEDYTNRHLYFRKLMAPNGDIGNQALHAYYKERMVTKNAKGRDVPAPKPGFLYRKDGVYYIAPCTAEKLDDGANGGYLAEGSRVQWDMKNGSAYVITGALTENSAGHMKKYNRRLFSPNWNDSRKIAVSVIEDYRNDKNRTGVNLVDEIVDGKTNSNILCNDEARAFAQRADIDRIAPCYFIESGRSLYFGHGTSFRIPYKNSIEQRVNPLVRSKKIDFADAVFGKTAGTGDDAGQAAKSIGKSTYWASRLSFEDAQLQGQPDFLEKQYVKALMSPNPTSFQLYLKQTSYPPAHWDDEERKTEIRGYKMYWHRKIGPRDWQASKAEVDGDTKNLIYHQIQPLRAGSRFVSRIRFQDLRKVELGALLKLFHLSDKEDIVFKLGQGKSLGLGSVRITPKLHLDTDDTYKKLFDRKGWADASRVEDGTAYISAFDAYAAEHLGDAKASYDQSLQELCCLLDWNNTKDPDWNDRIAAMSGDMKNDTVDERYLKRALLQTPEEVVHSGK